MFEKLDEFIRKNNLNVFRWAAYKDGKKEAMTYKNVALCQNVFSVSKSITSCAIGMLVEEGKLSYDDMVVNFFPEVDFGEGWDKVSVRNVLSQTVGIDSLIYDTVEHSTDPNENFLHFAINRKLPHKPGTHFEYNNANYYIASCLVEKLTGMRLADFLRQRFFTPLEIRKFAVEEEKFGHALGYSGMYLSIDALYNYGIALLNNGVFNGKKIFSSEWVKEATTALPSDNPGVGYGLGFRTPAEDVFSSQGAKNQLIFVCQKTNSMIALQAYFDDSLALREVMIDCLKQQ